MRFRVGDWVRFWTKNWPPDRRTIQINISDGQSKDVTGEGEYTGRGKIISVRPNGYLVCEEHSRETLVELDKGDRIERMGHLEPEPFTLGDLRRLLEQHKNAPDDVPVMVSLPIGFNCDEEGSCRLPDDHPELHDFNSVEVVPAMNVLFSAFEENSGASADGWVPPEEREPGDEWCFQIEVMPMERNAHAALRGCDTESGKRGQNS